MEVPHLADIVRDAEEQVTPLEGQVTGQPLPDWLTGSLYRAGPAKFQLAENFTVNHWFDGMAMLSRFAIKDGKVTLQMRFLQSDAYKKAMANKKTIFTEFGTRGHPDPSKGFLSRMVSSILPTDMTDNDFNNMYVVNGQLFAACETSLIHRINPDTLESLEKVDLHQHLGVNLCCSHPVTDTDGTVYTMGVTFIPNFRYQINRVLPNETAKNGKEAFGKAKTLLSMSSSWAASYSYYHSFAVTENYIVFLEMPLVLVLSKVMAMVVKGNSLKDCMEWHPEYKVKFYVVRKSDGKLLKTKYCLEEPLLQMHVSNAFEEGDQIVFDTTAYGGPEVFDDFTLEKLRSCRQENVNPARITRLVLPLLEDVKSVEENKNLVTFPHTEARAERRGDTVVLTADHYPESGLEYPTINPRLRGRRHRYCYVSGMYSQGELRSAVGRLDTETREWKVWRAEEHSFTSEATFVPRPGGTDELDGVLLTVVLTTQTGHDDYLALLDPTNMQELSRVRFGVPIPQMVHGLWTSDDQINRQ